MAGGAGSCGKCLDTLVLAGPCAAQQKFAGWGLAAALVRVSDKSMQWLRNKGWNVAGYVAAATCRYRIRSNGLSNHLFLDSRLNHGVERDNFRHSESSALRSESRCST